MSIYLFKTEEFYGGETKIFTDRKSAIEYLKTYQSCSGKLDAFIEEHKPEIPDDHRVFINVVREDGWQIELDRINWNVVKNSSRRMDLQTF